MDPNPVANPFILEGLRQIVVPVQVTLQSMQVPPPAAPPPHARHRHSHRT
jgi:hypothetical protein